MTMFFHAIDPYLGLLFAGIVALFTGLLWSSTRKLWRATEASVDAAKRSSEAAAKNADAAIMSHRPWIKIRVVRIESPLSIADEGAEIQLVLEIANVGNTPALNVRVIPQLRVLPMRLDVDLDSVTKNVIDTFQRSEFNDVVGFTIFHGDHIEFPYTLQVKKNILEEAAQASIGRAKGQVCFMFGGIASYRFGMGEGRTTFAYFLVHADTETWIITDTNSRIIPVQLKETGIGIYAR